MFLRSALEGNIGIDEDSECTVTPGGTVFYTGIDRHKRDSLLATYGSDGRLVKTGSGAEHPCRARRLLRHPRRPHRAVVESSGGWYWLADTSIGGQKVRAHGVPVEVDPARWAVYLESARPIALQVQRLVLPEDETKS
jgi:hypothetical protein